PAHPRGAAHRPVPHGSGSVRQGGGDRRVSLRDGGIMAGRPLAAGGRGVQGVHTVIGPTAHLARRRPLRHRLVLAAPTTVAAVRAAGGWLFDTAMTGWDVQVLAGDPRDGRALR